MKTAEEFYREKLKGLYPNNKSITLSQMHITAEQGMRWAHEYASQFNQPPHSEEEVCYCPHCESYREKRAIQQPSKEQVKKDKSCTICGVPDSQHGTACGWDNANFIFFPWEHIVRTNVPAEEKQLRYLISKSDDPIKLFSFLSNI